MKWEIVFAKHARKDAKKLAAAGSKAKTQELLGLLQHDPLQNAPACERWVGDLDGAYARRINSQHRLVYEVFKRAAHCSRPSHVDLLRMISRDNMPLDAHTQQDVVASRQL